MIVKIHKLKEVTKRILLKTGISENDATIVFEHLLEEELLKKHSHGFIRMPSIINSIKSFTGESKRIVESPSEYAMHISSDNVLGLVAGYHAAQQTISIASKKGVSIVASVGYKGTTGALGYYGRMLAKAGLVGIISCSSEYAVAPWGGRDAILGTNPIAISIPNEDNPIISDFSTAAMTYGDLMLAAKAGERVPYGIVLDSEGKPSNDPEDAENGCQLPMAGHKGYALGLAVEILAGLFIGAKAGKEAVKGSEGIIMLAFRPDLFVPQEQFLGNLKKLIDEIKNSALALESLGIRLPGEDADKRIREGLELDQCDIPEVVYKDLMELAKNYMK